MAPKKKQITPVQAEFTKAAAPVIPVAVAPDLTPPRSLEYQPPTETELWRVQRFDLLALEFALTGDWAVVAGEFHAFAESDPQRWFYVRRLFGMMPLIPPADVHPDDMRSWTREELCATTGLTTEHLQLELAYLRTSWGDSLNQLARRPEPGQGMVVDEPVRTEELLLGDALLDRFDFDPDLFKVKVWDHTANQNMGAWMPRSDKKNRAEMDWFLAKLARPEWQKMLQEPLAGSLARSALINELYLRRYDSEMIGLMPSSPDWAKKAKERSQIEVTYQRQMEDLQGKFPDMGVAGRVSFRGCISDLNTAYRAYYGYQQNRLFDKVHAALEMPFLLRTSLQLPSPRYRLGWQVAVVEAMHGLYDPNFRTQLRKSDLKKLDMGFKQGVLLARQELNEPIVNLERGVVPGEGDDFPDYEIKS